METTDHDSRNQTASAQQQPQVYGVELTGLSKTFGGDVPAVQNLTLRVPRGRFVSLLGPSGCGKTTTLRMIAGLETPNAGEIRILDNLVFSGSQGVAHAPARRKVGFVFQSYALWPHMSVAENLGYPLQRAGMPSAQIKEKVTATLKMLKAPQLADRHPGELSGGQQQRIALGRAIINSDNQVILFDEPLSNLDAKLREDLRMEIRGLQEDLGFTAIYVTHDQAEAMSMSDHVVIMRDGKIEREGPPDSVFHEPRSRYVAEFFGAHNIVPVTVQSIAADHAILSSPLGMLRTPDLPAHLPQPGQRAEAALAIGELQLAHERTSEQDFTATVRGVAYYGNHYDIEIDAQGCALRCRVASTRRFARGQQVYGSVHGTVQILER